MHITLESDYAIRIMIFMAQQNRRVDAKTISESTGVTLRFSLKILRKLAGTKIVKSFKGTQEMCIRDSSQSTGGNAEGD